MATHPATDRINPLKPIFIAHLFTKVDGMLLELLRSLSPGDWESPGAFFTKGIDRALAQSQVKVTGDAALALPVLGMVSIVST